MRTTLEDLLKKTIIFQFSLPHNSIDKTSISTFGDYCYATSSNNDLSVLIYNGIVDYALGEHNVDFNNLDKEQAIAISRHMRYEEADDDETKEKYGFYGEVVLNLILQQLLHSRILIAKGYFYNPVDAQETHGFDAFHFCHNRDKGITSIILGEAKFYAKQSGAIESVIDKISSVLTEDYLNKNFYAIMNEYDKTEDLPDTISYIFDHIYEEPKVNVYELLVNNNIKLIYPILIMCDQLNKCYEDRVKSLVETVNRYVKKFAPIAGIDVNIFFIFIPVDDTKTIKKEVIRWISEKKPLIR